MKTTTKPKPKPNKLHFLNRDRGYRFTNRDPILEEICNIITKSNKSTTEISELTSRTFGGAKVASAMLNNWLNGQTKKPQNYTMDRVGLVLGYRRHGWQKI